MIGSCGAPQNNSICTYIEYDVCKVTYVSLWIYVCVFVCYDLLYSFNDCLSWFFFQGQRLCCTFACNDTANAFATYALHMCTLYAYWRMRHACAKQTWKHTKPRNSYLITWTSGSINIVIVFQLLLDAWMSYHWVNKPLIIINWFRAYP